MLHVKPYESGDFDLLHEREESDAWAFKDAVLDLYDEGRGGLGWTGHFNGGIAAIGFIIKDPKHEKLGLCPVFTSTLITQCGREVTEAADNAINEAFEKLDLDAVAGTVRPGFKKGVEWCERLRFTSIGMKTVMGQEMEIFIRKRGD